MKFKRTDDLPNDTELLKGAAASPDAHMTGRGNSHTNRIFAVPQLSCKAQRSCQNGSFRLSFLENGRALRPKSIPTMISCKKLAIFSKVFFFPLVQCQRRIHCDVYIRQYFEFFLLLSNCIKSS